MLSPFVPKSLFCVQVRVGTGFRMQLGACDSRDFYRAKEDAVQVLRWLHRGHFYALPDDLLDLRDIVQVCGQDPRAAVVEVVRLVEIGPSRFDVNAGEVMCQIIDCVTREDAEDTGGDEPTVVEASGRPVTVQALAR